jgi:glycogen(starch) synthase
LKIVLVSEVFPPRAGGAGWSTRALALGLRATGHDVSVITTSPGPPTEGGIPVERLRAQGWKRLVVPRVFASRLARTEADAFHAQLSLSALGCLDGKRSPRVAVTLRDHWPICFWSTLISRGQVCPGCGVVAMSRCVQGRVPASAPFSWGAIPYMRADLWRKRRALEHAGASVAVSESVAAELRAAQVPRVSVVPNVLDASEVRAAAEPEPSFQLPDRFLLFVGKLEENKGARLLVPAVAEAKTGLPLVILGEGTQTHAIKFEATARDVPLIQRGWADKDDVLRAMARATVLVFPSLWPEPLSRVLLEGLALGTPMAAMSTGGTPEILTHDESGLLVDGVSELASAVAHLASDPALRRRLSEGARERARAFSPEVLTPRYEAVYRGLT